MLSQVKKYFIIKHINETNSIVLFSEFKVVFFIYNVCNILLTTKVLINLNFI